MADEGLLVEGCEVCAEEVVSRAEKTVMVHLEDGKKITLGSIVKASKSQVASSSP